MKQETLKRRSTVLSLSLQLAFPVFGHLSNAPDNHRADLLLKLLSGVSQRCQNSGPSVIKLFTIVIYKCSYKARVFVLDKPFQPSQMFRACQVEHLNLDLPAKN